MSGNSYHDFQAYRKIIGNGGLEGDFNGFMSKTLAAKDARVRELEAENERLRADRVPPPGHIIDDKGTVRRVLGTLPVTADGSIACQDAVVWHPINGACYPVPDGLNVAAKVYGGSTLVPVSECFATREAAEAAREAGGKA
jgi:hypothetical protein